jgi:hypothetical protein
LQRLVKQLWESKYKPVNTVARTETTATGTSSTNPLALSKPVNQFAAYLHKHKAKAMAHLDDTPCSDDEYARYIKERVEWTDDPIAWWQEPVQRHKYPHLSKMALNMLSIPAMAADVERLFSSAGLTLTDRRNRMGIDLLEALECLKSWNKIKEFNIMEPVVGNSFNQGESKA